MRGARRGPWVVLGVVAAVVLGGCTDGADPAPTPTPSVTSASPSATLSPSASASASPSATASGPTIPAAARAQTPAGAEAFVRFFFDQVNLAWTKPEPGAIAAVSSTDCKFCATTESLASYLGENGQHYTEKPVTVEDVGAISGAPAGQQYLVATLIQNASTVVDAQGKVTKRDARKRLPRNVALKWINGEWRMFAVEKTS